MTDGRYAHASGDDSEGCYQCWDDWIDTTDAKPSVPVQCSHPEPDTADPELCRWCSHTIERMA